MRSNVRVRMNLNTQNDALYPYISRKVETAFVCVVCWPDTRLIELDGD